MYYIRITKIYLMEKQISCTLMGIFCYEFERLLQYKCIVNSSSSSTCTRFILTYVKYVIL